MNRITIKDLERQVDLLNRLTGSPAERWQAERRDDGGWASNPGHYMISQAYGGCELQRICGELGGTSTPLNTGHIQKRELYEILRAFIAGIQTAQEEAS
jgi:hypothetical protein